MTYIISGANNSGNLHSTQDRMQNNYPGFYKKLEDFMNLLEDQVSNKESKSYYKFSDGEYYWLIDKQVGSVSPGRRDSFLSQRNLLPFREGVTKNDYLMCQMLEQHFLWFKDLFKKEPDFLVDFVYGLVANKWFTSKFDGKIGIIGAQQKVDLIKQLCQYQEYKDYLQFNGFIDYIGVRQKGLCDHLEEAELHLENQLKNSTASIFLVGIGHAQQALLHKMRNYKNAVYISVGSGIDAYAGVQDNLRPYMTDWVNYQLSNFDYSKIDIWKDRMLLKKKL